MVTASVIDLNLKTSPSDHPYNPSRPLKNLSNARRTKFCFSPSWWVRKTRAHSIGVKVRETTPEIRMVIAIVTAKLAEDAPDDSTHQQHGDEHRDQGEGDGDDGEAYFRRSLERRLERAHAAFDVADDVLQHDDGVVDHEANRQRQCQQRHIVDGEIQRIHDAQVPIKETGTASPGMIVAGTERRNRKITMITRLIAIVRVTSTSATESRIDTDRSASISRLIAAGTCAR